MAVRALVTHDNVSELLPLPPGYGWWRRRTRLQRKLTRAVCSCAASIAWGCLMAAVLQSIEGPAELKVRRQRAAAFDVAAEARAVHIEALRATLPDVAARAHLAALEQDISALAGERPSEAIRDWSFIGALYFSYTIMSTIGYGTFYANTTGGQLATLFLGIVGVASFGVSIALTSSLTDLLLDRITAERQDMLRESPSQAPAVIEGEGSSDVQECNTATLANVRNHTKKAGLTLALFLVVWFAGAGIFLGLIRGGGAEAYGAGSEAVCLSLTPAHLRNGLPTMRVHPLAQSPISMRGISLASHS
jgi:hypothetical protein